MRRCAITATPLGIIVDSNVAKPTLLVDNVLSGCASVGISAATADPAATTIAGNRVSGCGVGIELAAAGDAQAGQGAEQQADAQSQEDAVRRAVLGANVLRDNAMDVKLEKKDKRR